MRILVVDDEEMKRLSLAEDLEEKGYEVTMCANGADALAVLKANRFDVVVADLKMPEIDGMELLKRCKGDPSFTGEFVMITAYGSIPVAVEAMRHGAFDFITKPFNNERLLPILKRIEAERGDRELVGGTPGPEVPEGIDQTIMGSSPAMQRVKELVAICAETDTNVLLCGETGSGKDLIASVIHKNGARRSFPFVKVSCAVFPHELVASELYGHEKGAFTGADRAKKGRFELAAGGTLYLDDVDDIPFEEQVKLLRAIEERLFERVGGTSSIKANVRILAATKKDLLEQIREGSFREDLYYRLNVMRIDVPPLRERIEDIPQLARHLLQRISGSQKVSIHPEAMAHLASCPWPGNVRELANTLERTWLVGRGVITVENLSLGNDAAAPEGAMPPRGHFKESVASFERELLVRALRSTAGNKAAAARLLGMRPSTFRDCLAKHGL